MSLHLVCVRCGTENRISENRLGDAPICGRCRERLLPAKPLDVDGSVLERCVATDGLPLLVDCWAAWCGPCRTMAPQFEVAQGLLGIQVRSVKLDTEANSDLAARWSIRSIPTLILFANGREVARTAGVMDARSIARWTEQALS